MKKLLCLPVIVLSLFFASSVQAYAANFSLSPSSGDPSTINVQVDTGGVNIQSATAVLTYDSTKVNITVSSGSFLPVVNTTSTTNKITILGQINQGDLVGVSGTGTLATLTVSPQVAAGQSYSISFSCSSTDRNDSQILDMDGTNLLASDTQCSANVNGTYTVTADTPAATNTPAPTDPPANDDSNDDSSNDSNSSTNTSSSTTNTTTSTNTQPYQPSTLPQSGPEDWLKWITSGLALIGIGLLLL